MKRNKCIQLVKLAGSRGRPEHFCWQWLCCQCPSLSEAAVSHSPSLCPRGVHCACRQLWNNCSQASGRQMEWICQSLSLIINFCHSERGNISLPDPLWFDLLRHLRDRQLNLSLCVTHRELCWASPPGSQLLQNSAPASQLRVFSQSTAERSWHQGHAPNFIQTSGLRKEEMIKSIINNPDL